MAGFADHAAEGPWVRRVVGVWQEVGWVAGESGGGAAVGRLVAYETDGTRPVLDLLDQWLADGDGHEAPDLGISIVFYPCLAADGRTVTLLPGQSYQVADGAQPHRSTTAVGASLFIVD